MHELNLIFHSERVDVLPRDGEGVGVDVDREDRAAKGGGGERRTRGRKHMKRPRRHARMRSVRTYFAPIITEAQDNTAQPQPRSRMSFSSMSPKEDSAV
jgi:hypothetical protein